MRFKTVSISASDRIWLLEMVSKTDTRRCASEDIGIGIGIGVGVGVGLGLGLGLL